MLVEYRLPCTILRRKLKDPLEECTIQHGRRFNGLYIGPGTILPRTNRATH
ncbi:hypothetical protein BU16DRAFT_511617, partial [Lophium mytilinum]